MALNLFTLLILLVGAGVIAVMLRMADREGPAPPAPPPDAPEAEEWADVDTEDLWPPATPTGDPSHPPEPAPVPRRTHVRPIRLRIGSASAPAERSFAFTLGGEDLVLTGPACLYTGQLVFVQVEEAAIELVGRIGGETAAGHKTVRVDQVWADQDAFERWRAGEAIPAPAAGY